MAKIRNEIPILTRTWSLGSGSTASSAEIIAVNAANYPGGTFYLEVVAKVGTAVEASVSLRRTGTSTDDVTITIPSTTSSYTRLRSAAFTMPSVAMPGQQYQLFMPSVAVVRDIFSARIIVLQDTGAAPTATESHISMADWGGITASLTLVPSSHPTYFKYDAANWAVGTGTVTEAYCFVTMNSSTTKVTATFQLQVDDGSFAGWANVTGASGTTTQPSNLVTSSTFTLTDGRNYRFAFSTSNTKTAIGWTNAHIVIVQRDGAAPWISTTSQPIAGATGANEMFAQAFSVSSGGSASAVLVPLSKTGSPADNTVVDLCTAVDGAAVATGSIASSTLTTTAAWVTITFAAPYTISAATTYYLRVSRSGSRDLANLANWYSSSSSAISGNPWHRDSGTWAESVGGGDFGFALVGITGVAKQETYFDCYANTWTATTLQDYHHLWSTSEWSGVTLAHYFEISSSSASGGTSDVKLQDRTGPTDLTGSTVTDVDNRERSASVTMPTSGHEFDVIATTNDTTLSSSRVVNLVSVITETIYPDKWHPRIEQPYPDVWSVVGY